MASKEFSNTLKNLRIKAGYTQKQVYEHFKIPQSTFSSWEVGKSEPSGDMLIKLCEFYKCDMMKEFSPSINDISFTSKEFMLIEGYRKLDDIGKSHLESIMTWEIERMESLKSSAPSISKAPARIISYYQHLASAGSGEYLFDDVPTDMIEVVDNELSNRADFVIGVNGDSMEPTYYDGDKVFVRKTDSIPIGGIGIFTRGNECFIKELGVNRLISHNKKYNDIPANDEIRLVGEVLGKVVEE
ncbi:helix-turn-helix domain-containing protein [Enterocloster clostridioformis]|uniref:LexA family transcriptional regulator n=1 Tax=Enterocloster clostridioformis TaxID=1531 RepID=UPI001F1FB993|nr:S24 family peptidase [Enterocloster clostridioformis]MCF2705098.1 helix-turn-helix domain-containing protein [Enterocloster clostridioformis]